MALRGVKGGPAGRSIARIMFWRVGGNSNFQLIQFRVTGRWVCGPSREGTQGEHGKEDATHGRLNGGRHRKKKLVMEDGGGRSSTYAGQR